MECSPQSICLLTERDFPLLKSKGQIVSLIKNIRFLVAQNPRGLHNFPLRIRFLGEWFVYYEISLRGRIP